MADTFTNADGLTQVYGQRTASDFPTTRKPSVGGAYQELIVDFDFNHLSATGLSTWFDEDSGGGIVPDSPSSINASIPSGSVLVDCKLITDVAFLSGGAATIDIGTYQKDGTVIDLDGIDAAIAKASMPADTVIDCNGAQINAVVTSPNTDDTGVYVGVSTNVAAYTAGTGRLVIRYIKQ